MSERSNEHFTPAGWHTVTPRIVVHQPQQLVDFVKQVFGATGDFRTDMPTIVSIGDSRIMISEVGIRERMPAFLYVYVADTDNTYRRALDAGARSIEEPCNTPYGDRRGTVEDPWGNTWQIATYGESA
jgi:PhnB protein